MHLRIHKVTEDEYDHNEANSEEIQTMKLNIMALDKIPDLVNKHTEQNDIMEVITDNIQR